MFVDNTLRIDPREIFTILGSKPLQSTHSIIFPAVNAVEEAKRLASEIETEYKQLDLPLLVDAKRKTRKLSSKPQKTL